MFGLPLLRLLMGSPLSGGAGLADGQSG